ncbi:3-phosphoshikimate 1-carboxyvinyltransferase, partial [Campylobacter jejuni]
MKIYKLPTPVNAILEKIAAYKSTSQRFAIFLFLTQEENKAQTYL